MGWDSCFTDHCPVCSEYPEFIANCTVSIFEPFATSNTIQLNAFSSSGRFTSDDTAGYVVDHL
ncbi:hypothetical protein HTV45_04100 [Streptomyces sp. CHD11]|uniref:hypothetical protein n=1 Tax=Streptomyces sp. CHD11 TaxID=2741325 RepID=UPI001BFC9583|nr:hypothetical protein [Streptomyces sp. CHD11]MBT3150076.1 hypothetical protein [Streptomyces sp. CHD11]